MHERATIERILTRVIQDGECWVVSGWHDDKGYRNVSISGKTHKVHRVMFEWFWRRKLRRDVQVDHKCCNRSCCNPLHLQAVKNKKNSRLRDKRNGKTGVKNELVEPCDWNTPSPAVCAERADRARAIDVVHDLSLDDEEPRRETSGVCEEVNVDAG